MSIYIMIALIAIGEVAIMHECSTKRRSKMLFAILFVLSVVVVAFRNVVMVPDTITYKERYDHFSCLHRISVGLGADMFGYAPAFTLLNQLLAFCSLDFKVFSAVVVIINSFVFLKASAIIHKKIDLKKESSYLICTMYMLYLGYFGLFYNAIALRAGLAMTFAYLGFAYKLNNEKIYMIIAYIVATLFHTSAIFFILTTILMQSKLIVKKKITYIIWWGGIVFVWLTHLSNYLFVVVNGLLGIVVKIVPSFARYQFYADLYIEGKGIDLFASKKNLLFLILGLVFIVMRNRFKTELYDLLLNCYMVGISVLFLFSVINDIYRVADFFLMPSAMLLYWIFSDRNIFDKKSSILILTLLVLTQFIISLRITGIY